ncbi:MAG: SprT-like domain-containing protein [Cyclobacteriaceae bacterium]|nr:SprT-like domain-containing protein [Cyclobacteriaceae bacterium]MCH8516114.1 SprT-like domain-containing protein [Cyclobacteriaceae bacterium]
MTATYSRLFHRFIPTAAVAYCEMLYQEAPFLFRVSRPRKRVLGDYRYDFQRDIHAISVNENLPPERFLITFIHEIAHQRVQMRYGSGVQPHGKEWKAMFVNLMRPLLNEKIYDKVVLKRLEAYFKHPKASLSAGVFEENIKLNENEVQLMKLTSDQLFTFKGSQYRFIRRLRTFALCECVITQKQYRVRLTVAVNI